jgi:hypothetical protein
LPDLSHALGRGERHRAQPALRKLANRLVGILHGCLKTRILYDEATVGPPRKQARCLTFKLLGCLSCPAIPAKLRFGSM